MNLVEEKKKGLTEESVLKKKEDLKKFRNKRKGVSV